MDTISLPLLILSCVQWIIILCQYFHINHVSSELKTLKEKYQLARRIHMMCDSHD